MTAKPVSMHNNDNNDHNYKENSNFICSYVKSSTFKFFEGQKNKMAKFLADEGI